MSPFDHIVYWHWWVAAGVLVLLELTTPGLFFLCLAVAAGVTGLIILFVPLGFLYQLVLFAALAALATIIWRYYFKARGAAHD